MIVRNRSLCARTATPFAAAPLALGALLALGPSAPALAQVQPDRDPTLRETMEPADPTLPRDPQPMNATEPLDPETPGQASRTVPNYGRPRPRPDPRLAYPGAPRATKKGTLPRTQPYATSPRDIRRDYVNPRAPQPPPAYAQPAQIPRPPRPKLEDNPYAPTGLPLGSLRLYPYAETSIGQDSNATRSAAIPKPSTFMRLDAGLRAQSNWSTHEFRGEVNGSYYKFFDVDNADRPEGNARLNLRLDATRETKVDFELRGSLTTQSPGSPEFNVNAISRPAIFSYGATGGVTRNFGRLEATIAALIDRTSYEDGKLSNGNTINYAINDFNQYGLRGRIAYEVTPGVKPFIEVTGDTRQHDSVVDAGGFQRNSTGVQARAGSSFEITRTLTGEVAAGYLNRKYADSRLPELRGPTFDAALIWTATPLTTVTLRAATSANETTLANASGYISQRTSVEISHALLRNLTLGGIAQWQHDKYQGLALSQDTFTGTLKAEYALTRSIVVKGSFTHERLKSSVPGSDYTANVYLLGLRLQR